MNRNYHQRLAKIQKHMSQTKTIKYAVLSNDKTKKSLRYLLIQLMIDINEQCRHPIFHKHGIHNLIKFI